MVRVPGFGVPACRSLALVAALLLALVGSPGVVVGRALASPGAPIDRALQQKVARDPSAAVPVLIQRSSDLAAIEAVRARGGDVRRQLKIAHALAANVPASAV